MFNSFQLNFKTKFHNKTPKVFCLTFGVHVKRLFLSNLSTKVGDPFHFGSPTYQTKVFQNTKSAPVLTASAPSFTFNGK